MAITRDFRVWTSARVAATGAVAGLGTGAALAVLLAAFEPTWLGLQPVARLAEIIGTAGALGTLVASFFELGRT
jgi:hypothetical protein